MNGERYIKLAIIAALCEHPEQDKYKARAFSGENLDKVMEAISSQGHRLTKADFLSPDDEGKYVIDTPGFWKNFDKIRDLVHRAGDRFSMEDFTRPLNRDETWDLLESARRHGGLGKIFSQQVWEGRFDEMERLWYRVPVQARRDLFRNDGQLEPALKRGLLAAEGRDMPEDRLAQAGVSPFDVRQAFAERGNYDDLKRKLAQAGDYLRKEYLLLPDSSGDTVFCAYGAWEKYDDIVRNLQAKGEKFELSDFTRQVGRAPNILMRAAEKSTLNRVFAPEHWVGRLPEMMALWSCVLPGWKSTSLTSSGFDQAYAAAESLTYSRQFDFRRFEGKTALLQPLNGDDVGGKPVLPLGLKAFWENISDVKARLAEAGQKIALSDLRHESGYMGDTCLMSAVKFGHFANVVEIVKSAREALTVDDFLSKDRHGNTLINMLAERNQLGLAFSPDMWAGRVDDMKLLWSHVRVKDRAQVDIQQAETAARQATLRLKAKDRFRLPQGPK